MFRIDFRISKLPTSDYTEGQSSYWGVNCHKENVRKKNNL